MNKLNMQTTNVVYENIKRIGELFPNSLTERLDENGRPETVTYQGNQGLEHMTTIIVNSR